MRLTLYAIKQLSTGFFMPAGKSRGFTHDKPMNPELYAPRLFRTKRGAANALTWWLKGDVSAYYDEGWACGVGDVTPQPHNRKAEDMKVVPMTLNEGD